MLDFFFSQILGKTGVIVAVGLILFFYCYKNSVKLLDWIEDQTFGTRDYILSKAELLFWKVNPTHVTYTLVFLSFGLSTIILSFFLMFGKFWLGLFVAGVVSVIGWKIPRPFMNFMIQRRIKKFEIQMIDALTLLSNGLRAGQSLPQSLSMVVDELPAPISQEFSVILQQNKIGVPLDECFENLNKRMPTEDNEMFVTSISILRETGGNLAETFDTITVVIRERIRLKQKISTFIAQGMTQGGIVFSVPFVLLLYFTASDFENMSKVFTSPLGLIALIFALALNLFGGYIILKIVNIKV